jgi:2-oxoglutarate dehydrogenase E1 component
MARARQDLQFSGDRKQVLPLLLHGEAAYIGQGIVWETLNLSRLRGYDTGGSVHLVINNQVGFTTTPDEARSTIYSTDFSKAVEAPVFHVNAEDVEACCRVMEIATEFRQRYARDVVIDLYCYRKYGHNEGDDPTFTQPLIYAEVASKKPISALYAAELAAAGAFTDSDYQSCFTDYRSRWDAAAADSARLAPGEACAMHGRLRIPTPETGVTPELLKSIAESYLKYPEGFTVHPKLYKILEKRLESLEAGEGLDWGTCESFAFGSLLSEGIGIRLSGQDCGRATFSHRHAVLDDYEKPGMYVPLRSFAKGQAFFDALNSPLSEAGVMGFELGFSHVAAQHLVIWEGQFGDFANGAQVIIDQFLSSSEAKWNYRSGLVLLLPHGYEGQGPEHSSARLERYLQLCAEGNMVVAYPSTAAQYFHLLRRQGVMEIKRPLVVMTPKSLLRNLASCAKVSELTSGQFDTVIEEQIGEGAPKVVVFCSGKIFYDLQTALRNDKKARAKLVRVEQLYPFPQFELKKAMKGCEDAKLVWAQEEPQNMGSWNYIEPYLRIKLDAPVHYCGRPVSASTAAGSLKRHAFEQKQIVDEVLELARG